MFDVAICVAALLAILLAYMIALYYHVGHLERSLQAKVVLPPSQVLSWPNPPLLHQSQRTPVRLASATSKMDASRAGTIAGIEVPEARPLDGAGTASLDAIISSLPSLNDLAHLDAHVLDAIRFSASRSLDLNHWASLRQYMDAHYFNVGTSDHFLDRLVGYVGEQKAADFFRLHGHVVEFPATSNNPGYDILVDGHPVQVKSGESLESIRQHLLHNADIPVVTGPENADHLHHGMVYGIDVLDNSHLHHSTEQTLDSLHHDMHVGRPVIPTITVLRSGLRELGLLVEGRTDLQSAAKNIGLDAAGVSIGGWAGAKAGALIGSWLGPAGMVIGGVLGGIAGSMAGRAATQEIKLQPFKEAAEKHDQTVAEAQRAVRAREAEAHRQLLEAIQKEQQDIDIYVRQLEEQVHTQLSVQHRQYEADCLRFVHEFPNVLAKVQGSLTTRVAVHLQGIRRSWLPLRILWPSLADMQYELIRRTADQKHQVLHQARARFATLTAQVAAGTPAAAAAQEVVLFVRKHPFESQDLKTICGQLRLSTDAVSKRQQRVVHDAKRVCEAECAKHQQVVHSCLTSLQEQVMVVVKQQLDAVRAARAMVVREAAKIGINLEAETSAAT